MPTENHITYLVYIKLDEIAAWAWLIIIFLHLR